MLVEGRGDVLDKRMRGGRWRPAFVLPNLISIALQVPQDVDQSSILQQLSGCCHQGECLDEVGNYYF